MAPAGGEMLDVESCRQAAGDTADPAPTKTAKSIGQAGLTFNNVAVSLVLMCLSCAYALAATMSKNTDGSYPYQTVLVPLLAEALKAVISAVSLGIELRGLSPADKTAHFSYWTWFSFLLAGVPGIGYQVLNNLQFVTLYYLDMPTFQIFGNLKIVATGLAGHWMLSRKLSLGQWLGLLLLAIGAAVTQLGRICGSQDSPTVDLRGYTPALVCVLLSGAIGVFTEKFMKSTPQCSIHWQNLQLYLWGVSANFVALLWSQSLSNAGANTSSLSLDGFNVAAFFAVVSLSLTGLAISFLLRFADSIVKTYATVLSAPFSAIVAYAVLGSHIGMEHIVGLFVMVISCVFYYGGASLFASPKSPQRGA